MQQAISRCQQQIYGQLRQDQGLNIPDVFGCEQPIRIRDDAAATIMRIPVAYDSRDFRHTHNSITT